MFQTTLACLHIAEERSTIRMRHCGDLTVRIPQLIVVLARSQSEMHPYHI